MSEEERDDIGFAAFRILLFLNGQVGADTNTNAYEQLIAGLDSIADFKNGTKSLNLPNKKTTKVTTTKAQDLRVVQESIGQPWPRNEGFRFYGNEVVHGIHPVGLPYVSLEQINFANYDDDDAFHVHFLDIALSKEHEGFHEYLKLIEAFLPEADVCCGFAGYGFFILPAREGANADVIPVLETHRAALAYMPRRILDALKRTSATGSDRMQVDLRHIKPGIPDIGWKTWVGPEYWDRIDLDSIEASASDAVTINRTDTLLTLTAGSKPVWGKEGDDLSPYREAAKLLQTVRVDTELVRHYPFFAEHSDETIAYIERFDS